MVNFVFWIFIAVAVFVLLKYSSIRYERIWTYVLASLLIFVLFTFFSVMSYNNIEVSSFDGFISGVKVYNTWLFAWAKNTASITGNAIKTDWTGNFTNPTGSK